MNDVRQTVLNAVSNASRELISVSDLISILATGEGPGHLVRALYGDCTFETLDRFGAAVGVSRAEIRTGYAHARVRHAVSNSELDEE